MKLVDYRATLVNWWKEAFPSSTSAVDSVNPFNFPPVLFVVRIFYSVSSGNFMGELIEFDYHFFHGLETFTIPLI